MGELFEKCPIPGYRGHFRKFSKQLHFTYGTKVQPLGYIKTLIQMGSGYGFSFERCSKIVIYLPVTFVTINSNISQYKNTSTYVMLLIVDFPLTRHI